MNEHILENLASKVFTKMFTTFFAAMKIVTWSPLWEHNPSIKNKAQQMDLSEIFVRRATFKFIKTFSSTILLEQSAWIANVVFVIRTVTFLLKVGKHGHHQEE